MKYETVNHKWQYQKHFSEKKYQFGGFSKNVWSFNNRMGVKDIAGRY